MFIRTAAAAAVLVLLAAPANAFYCPKQGKSIDHAISKANLDAGQKAEARKLHDEGIALHNAGDHKGSVTALAASARILLDSIGM